MRKSLKIQPSIRLTPPEKHPSMNRLQEQAAQTTFISDYNFPPQLSCRPHISWQFQVGLLLLKPGEQTAGSCHNRECSHQVTDQEFSSRLTSELLQWMLGHELAFLAHRGSRSQRESFPWETQMPSSFLSQAGAMTLQQ